MYGEFGFKGIVPTSAWKKWEKPRKTSARITWAPAKIRTWTFLRVTTDRAESVALRICRWYLRPDGLPWWLRGAKWLLEDRAMTWDVAEFVEPSLSGLVERPASRFFDDPIKKNRHLCNCNTYSADNFVFLRVIMHRYHYNVKLRFSRRWRFCADTASQPRRPWREPWQYLHSYLNLLQHQISAFYASTSLMALLSLLPHKVAWPPCSYCKNPSVA